MEDLEKAVKFVMRLVWGSLKWRTDFLWSLSPMSVEANISKLINASGCLFEMVMQVVDRSKSRDGTGGRDGCGVHCKGGLTQFVGADEGGGCIGVVVGRHIIVGA